MQDKVDAKEMFFRYGGNHGFMCHDGVYDLYAAQGVTAEMEAEWTSEQQESLFRNLERQTDGFVVDHDFHMLMGIIMRCNDVAGLFRLMAIFKKTRKALDTFSVVLVSEHILDIVLALRRGAALAMFDARSICNEVKRALDDLDRDQYSVSDFYKEDRFILADTISSDSIRQRILEIRDRLQSAV